jgi:aerobic carbon-monoxide dehydrogenase large subunit
MTVRERNVGKAITPFEARKFVIGHGRYVDDHELPRQSYAAFLRSPHAHARIRSIDSSRAKALPGVFAIVTGADLEKVVEPVRQAPAIDGVLPTMFPTLPIDKVRFVGDPVACIVAESRYVAEDAAEMIEVDYEPLPAVTNVHTARDDGQPLVDESVPRNQICYQAYSNGDPDRAFAEADQIVEAFFSQHRQTHSPIEPRACLASWQPGEETITVWLSTQIPHGVKTQLAARLRLTEGQVRVIAPDVGGGFGQKGPLLREEVTVAAASKMLGRPVKWFEDRQENLLAALHAREEEVSVQAAVKNDGTILGIKADILTDFGAYSFLPANYMNQVVGMMIPGPYRFQDYAYQLTSIMTNKCPVGALRAPMLICSWVTEGTIDAIARQLELDPADVRRRNLVRADELPYVSATGQKYEAITPLETLEQALETLDYPRAREAQRAARASGRIFGIGIGVYVEPTAYGSAFYRMAGIPGSGHDVAKVRVEPSGAIRAQIGVPTQGQGHHTTAAQVLADEFQVALDVITVRSGDTDSAPYGMGTRGSRGGVVVTGALIGASRQLVEKMKRIAAYRLEVSENDLELTDGKVQVRGLPDRAMTIREIAHIAYITPMELPPGMEPGLDITFAYDPPPLTYANATHVCTVEIDRETGEITIPRFIVVEDCGQVLNPKVVEGQVHGAVYMGLSGMVYEEVVYDPESGQNLTGSYMDYLLATSTELPWFEVEHLQNLNPGTPLGVKGMAEGGVMGATAAIANAIADALAPHGIAVDRQPFTPSRILDWLIEAGVVTAD